MENGEWRIENAVGAKKSRLPVIALQTATRAYLLRRQ
jgi:hypothetical protein